MKKRILFWGILLVLGLQLKALPEKHPIELSDKGYISLLTCDPGKALYSAFGHSAVRVKDPKKDLDIVYNYGTFNFDTPNFYTKFIRGNLKYYLSMTHYKYFAMPYRRENREIREQILNLSTEEANRVFAFLQRNHKPENRYYQYDFFFDNCATRIRDIFPKVMGKQINFDKSIALSEYTFRDLLDQHLHTRRWAQFGINIILGQKTDRIAKARQYMFLPDYLEKAMDDAIIKEQGRIRPLVDESHKLYYPANPLQIKSFWLTPDLLLWVFLAAIGMLTLYELYAKRFLKGIDSCLLIILGLAGLLITFLWGFTSHQVTDNNWNIIWAFPLHLVAGIWLLATKKSGVLAYYLMITAVAAFLLMPLWGIIPQRFDQAFLPLLLIIIIRSLRSFWGLRQPISD